MGVDEPGHHNCVAGVYLLRIPCPEALAYLGDAAVFYQDIRLGEVLGARPESEYAPSTDEGLGHEAAPSTFLITVS